MERGRYPANQNRPRAEKQAQKQVRRTLRKSLAIEKHHALRVGLHELSVLRMGRGNSKNRDRKSRYKNRITSRDNKIGSTDQNTEIIGNFRKIKKENKAIFEAKCKFSTKNRRNKIATDNRETYRDISGTKSSKSRSSRIREPRLLEIFEKWQNNKVATVTISSFS